MMRKRIATTLALATCLVGGGALAQGTHPEKKSEPASGDSRPQSGASDTSGSQAQPGAAQRSGTAPPSTAQNQGAERTRASAERATSTSDLESESIALAELDAAQVRNLQTALRDQGYYQGEIDGQAGAGTRRALRQYYTEQARLAMRGMIRYGSAGALGVDTSNVQPVGGREESTRQSLRGEGSSGMQQGTTSGTSGSSSGAQASPRGMQAPPSSGTTTTTPYDARPYAQSPSMGGSGGRAGSGGSGAYDPSRSGNGSRGTGTATGTGTGTQMPGGVSP